MYVANIFTCVCRSSTFPSFFRNYNFLITTCILQHNSAYIEYVAHWQSSWFLLIIDKLCVPFVMLLDASKDGL